MIDVISNLPMFTVPFIHLKVDDWGEKKKDILQLINDKNFEVREGDFVSTDYHFLMDNKSYNYAEKVEEILKQEIKTFNEIVNLNYKIKDAWFEASSEKQYHTVHNHGMTGFSSVCFVEYDENIHTPTQFISPYSNFVSGGILDFSPRKITEGSLIFFPSAIIHYTNPNNDNKVRISLSFNLNHV